MYARTRGCNLEVSEEKAGCRLRLDFLSFSTGARNFGGAMLAQMPCSQLINASTAMDLDNAILVFLHKTTCEKNEFG